MPEFAYEALTSSGLVLHGRMSVADELELEVRLREQGRFLIHSRPQGEAPPADARQLRPAKPTDGKVKPQELLAFSEYLWGSVQAGIPILTTLSDLEVQLGSKRLRKITAELRDGMMHDGKSLSEAMSDHPRAFPELYIGTIEAGELSGQLDYALGQLVGFLEWRQEINLQLRQATAYPAIVFTVMVGLVLVLVSFVYPRLSPVFTSFDVQLPLATRIVMAVGNFLRGQWHFLVGGVVGTALAMRLWYATRSGRLALDSAKLRMPLFGPLLHQVEMARVVTYLGLFYRTGVDLIKGLVLMERIIPNRRISVAIRGARDAIMSGDSLAHAFGATNMFPLVVIRSLALGEATGKLDDSLQRARKYYEREGPAAVRRMLSALQPLLIILLGGLLLIVALSIFLPILAIYQNIG